MGIFDFFIKNKKDNKVDNFYNVSININSNGNIDSKETYLYSSTVESLKKKYIAFDIETTGLNPVEDRIIELGAVVFENGQPTKKFSSLVNAHKNVSIEAMRVNNISNEMLQSAPAEKEIYPKFIEFLGNALLGETIICAHNAGFDISFLENTLARLGYNANIKYIDTLKSSRELINGLENYKQITVSKFFNIESEKSHRAVSDAEVCGKILWNLLKGEMKENQGYLTKENDKALLDDYEKILFAYVVNLINKNGYNTDYLVSWKTSNGYIVVGILFFGFFQYKYSKKGKYIIMKNKYIENVDLPKESCTITEGGSDFTRVYFNSLEEINILNNFILEEYNDTNKRFIEYLNRVSEKYIIRTLKSQYRLSNQEAERCVEEEKNNKLLNTYYNEIKIKKQISRDEVTISPINNRVPISEIEIIGCYNWEDGWEESNYEKWRKAEVYFDRANKLKQNGDYNEAIKYFDIAREKGYITEYLYECYAMTYHKLKDYDNEIDILEEGMEFFSKHNGNVSILTARRDKAVQTKYNLLEKEKIQQEKSEQTRKKEERKEQYALNRESRKELRKNMPKKSVGGRVIIQMDDDGNIIKRFISIAEAVRETGINSKSIRDAAKGVQKHAGGFVWKYEEDTIK